MTEKESELERYRNSVRTFAESKSELMFSNNGPDHACIVASTIFDYSVKTINIFTESMKGVFSSKPECLSSLGKFISRGGKVSIIVYDADLLESRKSSFLNRVDDISFKEYRDSISIKKLNPEAKEKIKKDSPNLFFMTGDDNKFRMQINDTYKAIVCFNNLENTEMLNNLFVWLSSKTSELSLKSVEA